MEPCSVSTAATRRTPKSSVRTRMPVTGQFSMIWEREEKLLPQPPAPLARAPHPATAPSWWAWDPCLSQGGRAPRDYKGRG